MVKTKKENLDKEYDFLGFLLTKSSFNIFNFFANKDTDYQSKIHKDTILTNTAISKTIEKFDKRNFLTKKKKGKTNILILTEKGKKIRDNINKVVDILREVNQDGQKRENQKMS